MDSVRSIKENYAYFYYIANVSMPIINSENIKTEQNNEIKERKNFIKQYDKNGKIVLPVWEISGRNFDIKR